MFKNRKEAGLLLASKLENYSNNKNVIAVTIPRGGVPIGYVIAKKLQVPLEIVLSKKIGHPSNKEYAIGAVTLNDSILSVNTDTILKEYINDEINKIRVLLKQRQHTYYGDRTPISLKNKIVILIDDGVATGNTLISSINLIKNQQPAKLIVALPVGPPSVINKIKDMPFVNETICLLTPDSFYAVGQFYEEFDPVEDTQVIKLLNEANNFLL